MWQWGLVLCMIGRMSAHLEVCALLCALINGSESMALIQQAPHRPPVATCCPRSACRPQASRSSRAPSAADFNPADIAELRDSKQDLILKVQSLKKVRGCVGRVCVFDGVEGKRGVAWADSVWESQPAHAGSLEVALLLMLWPGQKCSRLPQWLCLNLHVTVSSFHAHAPCPPPHIPLPRPCPDPFLQHQTNNSSRS